jgi:hypothetical protein
MVRLTADLILRSPQYFNAVRQRELDLRGTKFIVTHNYRCSVCSSKLISICNSLCVVKVLLVS